VQKSGRTDLLETVAASEPIAGKLRAIERTQWPVRFSHVIQPAQAFLAATIALKINNSIWVFCPSVHSQELFYESLLNWQPNALFLPEAEFAAIENVLPDPEMQRNGSRAHASRARVRSAADCCNARQSRSGSAKRGTLQSAVIHLRRGVNEKMERLLEQLVAAVMNASPKSPPAGNSPCAAALSISIRGRPATVRSEFLGDQIDSLREFDIDTQTSVRDLRSADILLGAPDDQGGVRPRLRWT
jgi:transcription-repair coupling factor (superfamily II helicase)